jgi:MFS transporter, FLVCR family, feline leukemia virus subgroup C receptor-related protein
VLLCAVFALMDGIFVSFAAILSLLFTYYNVPGETPTYSTATISIYGGLTTIFGVTSSILVAVLLQNLQKFLTPLRIVCCFSCVIFIIAIFTIPSLDTVLVGFNLIFLGIFLVPIIPISMVFASELTFPIDAPLTNGLLLMFGQGGGAIFGIVGTPICKANPLYLLLFYTVMAVIACLLTMFMIENLRKLNYQKQKALEAEEIERLDEEVRSRTSSFASSFIN